jgi:hypothetical protein
MPKISDATAKFVRSIFARDRQKSELAISSRELLAASKGGPYGSQIDASSIGGLNDALGLDRRLLYRYWDYEEMDEYPDISCLTGDSLIFTLHAGWVSISELTNLQGPFWVLSYDHDRRSLVPALCACARKTGEVGHGKPMVRVVLDNGASIRCTSDHLFMTKDEEWIEAGALRLE